MNAKRILIVEDEAYVAMNYREILTAAGYSVIGIAQNESSFLDLLADGDPDLLVVDIELGENRDGIELVNSVNHERNLPVVFVTAYTDSATFDRAKSTYPCAFLAKPVQSRQLVMTIELGFHNRESQENRPIESKESRHSVFISYSHKDRRAFESLLVHLRPIEREGIEIWNDSAISAGQYWRAEIERALERASTAVLLVSPDFLASNFIHSVELPRILVSAKEKGLLVLMVILKPCRLIQELDEFQTVNPHNLTLSEMRPAQRDRVWVDLAGMIASKLEQ